MFKQRVNPALLPVAFLSLLLATPAAGAKSFKILTAQGNPAHARDGAVAATVPIAPFDGSANSLYDGVDRFYVVEDNDGNPLSISVGKNPRIATVRLAFDDSIDDSADVDTRNSAVHVSPSTVPADRATAATVVVKPVDGFGVALGAGLNVSLDPNALFPGLLLGTVKDNMDGSYTATVVGVESGQGTIVVSVEKQELDAQPTVNFEFIPLSDEQAELLQTMDALQAEIDRLPETDPADKLTDAVGKFQQAVTALSETPPDRVDALHRIKEGLEKIENALAVGLDAAAGEAYMASAANVARALAVEAISIAVSLGGSSQAIDEALAALDEGDGHLSRPDHVEAVKAYKDAANIAAAALDLSVEPIVKHARDAIGEIENAVDRGLDPVEAKGYMKRLAAIARQLAMIAIDGAQAAQGAPTFISEALIKVELGDEELARGNFGDAAKGYENASASADEAAPGSTYDVASLSSPRSALVQLLLELQAAVGLNPGTDAAEKLNNAIEDLEGALAALP